MNGKAFVVEDGEVVAPVRIVEDAVFESVLGIMTELEYTGHYVTDTARLQILVAKAGEPLLGLLSDVRRMAVLAQHMLQQGLVAFERQELGWHGRFAAMTVKWMPCAGCFTTRC